VALSPQYQASPAGAFGPVHTPYKEPPFDLLPHGPRTVPADALFHPSVQTYLDRVADYAPQGLAALLKNRRLAAGALQA